MAASRYGASTWRRSPEQTERRLSLPRLRCAPGVLAAPWSPTVAFRPVRTSRPAAAGRQFLSASGADSRRSGLESHKSRSPAAPQPQKLSGQVTIEVSIPHRSGRRSRGPRKTDDSTCCLTSPPARSPFGPRGRSKKVNSQRTCTRAACIGRAVASNRTPEQHLRAASLGSRSGARRQSVRRSAAGGEQEGRI